jgi:hypothetical protein
MDFIKREGIISYQEKMEVPFPAMGDIPRMQSTLTSPKQLTRDP